MDTSYRATAYDKATGPLCLAFPRVSRVSIGNECTPTSLKSTPTLSIHIPTGADWPDHRHRALPQDWANALVHKVLTAMSESTITTKPMSWECGDACPEATKAVRDVVTDFYGNLDTEIVKGSCPDRAWEVSEGYQMPDAIKEYALHIDTGRGGHGYAPIQAQNSSSEELADLDTTLCSDDAKTTPAFGREKDLFYIKNDPVSASKHVPIVPTGPYCSTELGKPLVPSSAEFTGSLTVCLENGSHRGLRKSTHQDLVDNMNAVLCEDQDLMTHPEWESIFFGASGYPDDHLPFGLGRSLKAHATEWLKASGITCHDLLYGPSLPNHGYDDVVLTVPALDGLHKLSSERTMVKPHYRLSEWLKRQTGTGQEFVTTVLGSDRTQDMLSSLNAIRATKGDGPISVATQGGLNDASTEDNTDREATLLGLKAALEVLQRAKSHPKPCSMSNAQWSTLWSHAVVGVAQRIAMESKMHSDHIGKSQGPAAPLAYEIAMGFYTENSSANQENETQHSRWEPVTNANEATHFHVGVDTARTTRADKTDSSTTVGEAKTRRFRGCDMIELPQMCKSGENYYGPSHLPDLYITEMTNARTKIQEDAFAENFSQRTTSCPEWNATTDRPISNGRTQWTE